MIPTTDIPEIHLIAVVVGSLLVLDAVVSLLFLSRLAGVDGDRLRPDGEGVVRDGEGPAEKTDRSGSGGDVPEGVDRDADLVVCRECGTTNERGYRFCRRCVSELAGGYDVATSVRSQFDRRTP